MAFAYIILCHKNPEHVIRLIRRLEAPGNLFVVHVDARAERNVYQVLHQFASASENVHLTRRVRCYWGGFGIVAATLECIGKIADLNLPIDYAILLSGQDYPIKSSEEISSFIKENAGKQFIESFSLVKPNRWSPQGGPFNALNRIEHWTTFLRSRRIHLKARRRFPLGWEPHGGSQWWCLSRECVLYIHSFVRRRRSFVRFFKHVFIPDEAFFQSIVSNSPFGGQVVSDDLRYLDWSRPNPSLPRTLDTTDFERLRLSPKLFARKFEEDRSAECLNRIDNELLSRECSANPTNALLSAR